MATYRFSVLVLENYAGFFTASLIDDDEAPAAFGKSEAEVLNQLKDYLDWQYQIDPWHQPSDIADPRLVYIRVAVKPEYQIDDRAYPCDESIVLRVPCVHGRSLRSAGGTLVCTLPTLGHKFYYYEPGRLKELVTHYVSDNLRGHSPRDLTRFLQPKSAVLKEIVLHGNRREIHESFSPSLEVLGQVAEPLGDKRLRKRFSKAWERDREVADLVRRIREERSNVLIVGETGCGKTSVMIESVRLIERQPDRRTEVQGSGSVKFIHRHWMTSGARLIAGMQYLGMWQERCEKLIGEISEINGLLCIDNLLELINTGSSDVTDSLANFFLPYLQRGELKMVAEATPSELDACRRLLPGFVDMFQILNIDQFSSRQAITVINRLAGNLSRNSKIRMAQEVPSSIHRLFHRFQPYRAFPGRSVAFINELFERAQRSHQTQITESDVIEQFVRHTGLPELFLRDDRPLNYDDVLNHFKNQVIGQEAACAAASRIVTTIKSGLNDPNRPFGVLLFCGPTGVGKTEMARALSRYIFGHAEQEPVNDRLIQLDLSEFAGWGAAHRMLTGPDGEPSELIKRVRKQPFCVILLDEIEKADADVFDVMLSVFDEGRLTDRFGRVTTFRSAVIIMTSNLGADKLQTVGFETSGKPSYSREAMNFFRPEFFNRIDSVIQFNSLSREMMRDIAIKELREIANREGILRFGLKLEWADNLIDHLVNKGFDQRYGARPLQRTIESLIIAPLARRLLDNPEYRNTSLKLSVSEDKLVISASASR